MAEEIENARLVIAIALVAVFLSRLVRDSVMIDRLIGLAGLILAIAFWAIPIRYPAIPKWVIDLGILAGGVLIGITVAPFVWRSIRGTP